ncbi:hypothetical protein J7E50_25815 [Pedobacter sp. ISL-68]|uniref:hypothetical protein n=1 Tax=unclassified Pedobacter TaxID=2628915 RepID=UPI001BEBFB18|nr:MULTISPECIES: hypothetical protein [unclassified Pedobacter]MBT2564659.1 hypothetical protein [Pedobacter sp. ISL-64]MBT2593658.1 hypothetical protein [Pedobacter sp. ISL-68]
MEIKESSEYVKARAVLLAEYFAERDWLVVEGKNNSVLFYIPADQEFHFSQLQLADIIAESDYHVIETGLKLTSIIYMFYQMGKLKGEVEVWPITEFDIYTG